MGGLDIVGLGLATVDVLVRVSELPTWEHSTAMSAFMMEGGGPVGTALVAAARLGVRVGYVGTGGDDQVARLKRDTLTCEGVDVSRFVVRPGPERNVVLVCVDEATGERAFTLLRDRHRNPLLPEELDRAYITSAAYLHLDGHHLEASLAAAQWMHAAGKRVMLDGARTDGPLRPGARDLVALTDILVCGEGYVQALTGYDDLFQAGRAALDLGPRIVVQTAGAQGCYTTTPHETFHTPAFDVPVVDTTGAGDVFHGAYLVALLKGWDLHRAADLATAVAALKCTRLGGRSGIPSLEQALGFLQERRPGAP